MTELSERARRSIELRTKFNFQRMERAMMMVTPSRLLRRKHEARRAASRQCKVCYYLREGGIVGQAFRKFTCGICGQEKQHPNTGVPKFCTECCDLHELCQTCCAKRDP